MKYLELSIREESGDQVGIDGDKVVEILSNKKIQIGDDDADFIECRAGGDFEGKALYLPNNYDYILGVDTNDSKILVVLKEE